MYLYDNIYTLYYLHFTNIGLIQILVFLSPNFMSHKYLYHIISLSYNHPIGGDGHEASSPEIKKCARLLGAHLRGFQLHF